MRPVSHLGAEVLGAGMGSTVVVLDTATLKGGAGERSGPKGVAALSDLVQIYLRGRLILSPRSYGVSLF